MQSTEPEKWMPVLGYEELYEVSSCGRVRRIAAGRGTRPGRVLRSRVTARGYPRVNLSSGGRMRTRLVHHLVLEAFVGACPPGMEALHADDDPGNPRLSNLSWGTHAQNMRDQVSRGRHYKARESTCRAGHALVSPNLRPGRAYRECLSCARARAYTYKRGLPFDPDLADQIYARIMLPPPPPVWPDDLPR